MMGTMTGLMMAIVDVTTGCHADDERGGHARSVKDARRRAGRGELTPVLDLASARGSWALWGPRAALGFATTRRTAIRSPINNLAFPITQRSR